MQRAALPDDTLGGWAGLLGGVVTLLMIGNGHLLLLSHHMRSHHLVVRVRRKDGVLHRNHRVTPLHVTLVPRGVDILVGVAPRHHALGSLVVHPRVVLNMRWAWHSMVYSRFPHHCHSGAVIVRHLHAGIHVHGSSGLHHSSSNHGHPSGPHLLRRGSAMHHHLRVVHPHSLLLGMGTHHGPSMNPVVHHLTLPHYHPMLLRHHIWRVYHLLSGHDSSTHYLTGPGVPQVTSHSRRLRLHRHLRVHSRRNGGHPSRVRIVRERRGGSRRHSRGAHCKRNGSCHVGVRNGSCRGGADVWESWSRVSGGAHDRGVERGASSCGSQSSPSTSTDAVVEKRTPSESV
jgi:hypothetical protein